MEALECSGLAEEESAGTQIFICAAEFRKPVPILGDQGLFHGPEPKGPVIQEYFFISLFLSCAIGLSSKLEDLPEVWHLRGEGILVHCFSPLTKKYI